MSDEKRGKERELLTQIDDAQVGWDEGSSAWSWRASETRGNTRITLHGYAMTRREAREMRRWALEHIADWWAGNGLE